MSDATNGAPDNGDRIEMRLGLVMTGGVSLAIWMGGAAYEIDRLRRGDGGYLQLLDHAGLTPVVDVAVGTSAGGLNGTLMASAVAWGAKLTLEENGDGLDLRKVWRDDGDLAELMHDAGDPDPTSMLEGDEYFLKKVDEAFTTLARHAGKADTPTPTPELPLHLIATTTLMTPASISYEDSLGNPVSVSTSLGQFHFEKSAQVDHFGASDEARAEAVPRLARAARSSASFPFAFEPGLINVTRKDSEPYFGPGADNAPAIASFGNDTYVLDGGLVDNEPLQQCLDLIEKQPADQPVKRVVLFVSPLADPPDQSTTVNAPDPPTLLEVGTSTLLTPRDRDISEQLDAISVRRIHQERLAAVSSAIAGYEGSPAHLGSLSSVLQGGGDTTSAPFTRYDRLSRATNQDRSDLTAEVVQELLRLKQAALNVQALLGRVLTLESDGDTREVLRTHRQRVAGVITAISAGREAEDEHWAVLEESMAVLTSWATDPATPEIGASQVARELRTLNEVALASANGFREALLVLELLQSAVTNPQVRSPQQMTFVEISSFAPNCFDGRSTSGEKLTGVQLDHFGAFYLSSWRMNDWMWGRLDGSRRLVELLVRISKHPADVTEEQIKQQIEASARPIQLQILREELPSVARAIEVDRSSGASTSVREGEFIEAVSAWSKNTADDDLLVTAFRACRVGEERIGGQVGSEHFGQLTTRAASVGVGMIAGQPQATLLKPALAGARSVLRLSNVLANRHWPPAGYALLGFLAAAAGSMLAVGIVGNNTAIVSVAGVALLALLLAAVLNHPDGLTVALGGLGVLLLLSLAVTAMASGVAAGRIVGAGLGALAGLLLVGLLLPSRTWARVVLCVGAVVLAAVVFVGLTVIFWHWVDFGPVSLTDLKCGTPDAQQGCPDLYFSGVTTGALLAAILGVALLVVGLACVAGRKKASTT